MAKDKNRCRWISLEDALAAFAFPTGSVQSQDHIRPLHWYVACRLVVEGGFLPEEVVPRPPFEASRTGKGWSLRHVPGHGEIGERTVLGGLKTKEIDVTVAKPSVGPCLAVSIKGTMNAFRNLTNRMEEAVGDCTNLHIAYPNLVYGFLHVMRANKEGPCAVDIAHIVKPGPNGDFASNDIAIRRDGTIADGIERYHDVLSGLDGRQGIRNDITRYEAVGLALIEPRPSAVMRTWPPRESPLRFEQLFERMYREYDRRYVFAAPQLASKTTRLEWREDSPALQEPMAQDYAPRTK